MIFDNFLKAKINYSWAQSASESGPKSRPAAGQGCCQVDHCDCVTGDVRVTQAA